MQIRKVTFRAQIQKKKPYKKNGKLVYKLLTAYEQGQNSNKPNEVEFDKDDVGHMVALYDGEIAYVDSMLKKFFKKIESLKLDKNTIIVLLSEHGDMFGEHGCFMRGGPLRGTFYDPVLHVPLIIKHPNIKARRVKGFVQIVDITPTLLGMMGVSYNNYNFQGKNVLKKTNSYIYAGSQYRAQQGNIFFNGYSKVEVIQGFKYKLIREKIWRSTIEKNGTNLELYDMINDKKETVNMAKKYPAISKKLTSKLDKWAKEIKK